MSDSLSIQANLREKVGTGHARSLRSAGYVPAVIYSKGEETKLVSIAHKEAEILYNKAQVNTAMVKLKLKDKEYNVFPKQFNCHPVSDVVEHVDFMLVSDKATDLRMEIPVKIKGKEKSPGIKKGGVVNVVFRALPCKIAKNQVPPCIEIDISKMDVGMTLHLKDIVLPEGIKLLIKDLNQTFLKLTGKRKAAEEAAISEEGAEGAEGGDESGAAKEDEKKSAA